MDANNNQRFDDDQEYIFDTTSTERHYPEVNVNFDYFNGRTIQPITVPYTVNVYSSRFPPMFIDGKKMERLVHMGCPLYKEARYTSGRSEYVFHVTTNYMGVYKNVPFKLAIQLISKNDTIENYPYNYISTEILEFNQGLYKIDSLSKDTLYLNKIENTLYDGGRQGSMAHEISGEGIMDSKPYSLRKQRGKYTVINFWGSWCTPCIEELPELKALQEKYNKISFLSVAADYPRDIPALKKLITDNNLTWPQLSFDRSKLREGVLYNYKIQAFPTTILVDPNGKIVVRGRSASALKEIDNYLIEKKIF